MPIEVSKEQSEVLARTSPCETPAEFEALRAEAKPRMAAIVREVQEPNQAVGTTVTELRDLAVTVLLHQAPLEKVKYGPEKREGFIHAIRLVTTAQAWFGEGVRTGAFRARSAAEVVEASRPWRARLKAFGEHAFVFDEALAAQFADVNSTGTVDEEVSDLLTLNNLIGEHKEALLEVGVTEQFIQEGLSLYEEAHGRDLGAIAGVRNRAEATELRNRLFTFAILLGREARAAGVNACYGDDTARRRFEAASFREALRSLRPRRGKAKADGAGGTAAGEGKGNGAAAGEAAGGAATGNDAKPA